MRQVGSSLPEHHVLRARGAGPDARVDAFLAQWGDGPHILNLGHGVLPDTPIACIEQVVARVTGG